MKKLLLIFTLIPLFGFSQVSYQYLKGQTEERVKDYESIVRDNDGKFYSEDSYKNVNAFYMQSIGSEMMDSVKFMWLAEAASSKEENRYAELYDMSGLGNNGTQTTESSQPYVTNDWIPSGHEAMKNPNGDSRYIEHDEISFAANEAWSVTFCGARFGNILNASIISSIAGNQSGTDIRISASDADRIEFVSESTVITRQIGLGSKGNVGKNTVYHFIAYGDGSLSFAINGVIIKTFTSLTNRTVAVFRTFMAGRSATPQYFGNANAHIIRAQALTASQVLAEAQLLQSIYPEIPSVTIGTQTWATSNCEMVATPMGSVIANVTDATEWASSQSIYDDSITAGATIYEATKAAAMWAYPNNDTETGSWSGKIYNKFAASLIQQDITTYNSTNIDWGYHIPTRAELTILSAIGGNKAKLEGTDYWTTANGTNKSGFSALGTGYINSSGVYTGSKSTTGLLCSDADYVRQIIGGVDTFSEVAITTEGYPIRFIKD